MPDGAFPLSPQAAWLLASLSRQLADSLPAPASNGDAALDTGHALLTPAADADEELYSRGPRATCIAVVLGAPVRISDDRPAWLADRDATAEVVASADTLVALRLKSGALVKVRISTPSYGPIPGHACRQVQSHSGGRRLCLKSVTSAGLVFVRTSCFSQRSLCHRSGVWEAQTRQPTLHEWCRIAAAMTRPQRLAHSATPVRNAVQTAATMAGRTMQLEAAATACPMAGRTARQRSHQDLILHTCPPS